MNNPTPLHFYKTKGKNVCVLMLLCVPLSMMDIPGPCKHAITMDHLLQLKQLIGNQVRTGCSFTYTFIERKQLTIQTSVLGVFELRNQIAIFINQISNTLLLNYTTKYLSYFFKYVTQVTLFSHLLTNTSPVPMLREISVMCYVKATLPRVLELFNVHFKFMRGSGSAQAVVSIQNLILNIYSQHCIPSLNEELEEDPVAFERQYNETPVQALQRVEEVLSLYLHLITSTNTPLNWTCEQEYSSNVTPTVTPLTTSTEAAVGLFGQDLQGSSSDDFYRLGFIVVSICGGFLFLLTAYCLLERKKLQRQLHRTRMSSDWGLQVVENFEIQEEVYQINDQRKAFGSHLSTAF